MNDEDNLLPPSAIGRIEAATKELGFKMSSDHKTGCLLRSLASSKPAGRILELGTGTGLSAAWMLDGMDSASRLLSVDNNKEAIQIAQDILGNDDRVEFCLEDGAVFLRGLKGKKFDVVFADTWPGKVTDLDLALDLVDDGGFYVVDDMTHQPHWDDLDWDHTGDIQRVMKALEDKRDFIMTKMDWSTGIIILTKKPNKTLHPTAGCAPV